MFIWYSISDVDVTALNSGNITGVHVTYLTAELAVTGMVVS